MSNNKNGYGMLIFGTALITSAILVALTILAVNWGLPYFNISLVEVYPFLGRLLLVLIIVDLIIIWSVISSLKVNDKSDDLDVLEPTPVEKKLYQLPADDASSTVVYEKVPVVETIYVEKEVPVDPDNIPLEAYVTGASQGKLENMNEAQLIIVADAVEKVAEYKGVDIAINPKFNFDFSTILEKELASANALNYDLTIVLIKITAGDKDRVIDIITTVTDRTAYNFLLDDGTYCLVLPFYAEQEAKDFLNDTIIAYRAQLDGTKMRIGFASRSGRSIVAEDLIREAEAACKSSSSLKEISEEM